jgi:copper chaperone CopZ
MKLAFALLSFTFVALVAACQKADEGAGTAARAEPGAKPAPAETSTTTVVPAAAAPATAKAEASCGGACGGGSCGGACGGGAGCGGCMAAGADEPAAAVPADAQWTELKVTGMHCGGCARRVKKALAGVDGVAGVEVDWASGTVKIATPKDGDPVKVAALATPKIDALGFQVVK